MRKSFYVIALLAFCFILNSVAALADPVSPYAPIITLQPRDTTTCNTGTPFFKITAIDTGSTLAITYVWFWSGDGGTTWDTVHNDGSIYSGATTNKLQFLYNPLLLDGYDGHMYECLATNDSGSVFSAPATLHIQLGVVLPINGNTLGCVGAVLILTDTITGGVWSTTNHAIDTIDNSGNLYCKHFGNDTVKYTLTNTCGTNFNYTVVHIDTYAVNAPILGPAATCVGNSIDLTNANVLGTGTWSITNASASITSSGVVTALAAGMDTVIYTFTNGCGTIDTFMGVEIDTMLASGTISGASGICAGSWISLTPSLPGGIWLSSNSSVAVTDMSGNVTGISQGTSTISYFFSNACGASSATHTVTVSVPASMITGLDSVGIGRTRTYMDSTIGGTWSVVGGAATVGSSTGVVTGVSAGSATLLYTVTNTCGTTSEGMTIYVGAAPSAGVIHGKDTVCTGHTITVSDSVVGGVWTNGNDTIASISGSGLVTGLVYGVDHITYTVSNGFGSGTSVKSIFVNRLPIDSISVPNLFAEGGSYYFYGYTLIDTTWVATPGTWTSSNDSVGNFLGAGFFVVCCYSGTTTIKYSAQNTCGHTDTSFTITIPHFSGVNQVSAGNAVLNVYPNPSGGNFTINLLSSISEEAQVTITDIVGQKVKEFTISTNQSSELNLDQPDGIYFLTATSSTGKYSAKITITK